jgi:uncharacterized damage-inducible protein DinB
MEYPVIWFERKFKVALPLELFPVVVERLRGAPARLEENTSNLSPDILTKRSGSLWTIKEHAGHLGDLEPLWDGRIDDFLNGAEKLRDADLKNSKTHNANHNETNITVLLRDFRSARQKLVSRLDALDSNGPGLTALHPRLEQPMRMIDLAFFIAEHDDHHLAKITDLSGR